MFLQLNSILENNFKDNRESLNNKVNTKPLILSLVGPNNLGFTYVLKKICDMEGYYFIKKDFEKFHSIHSMLNYFKKLEFSDIKCKKIFLFKNCSKPFKLIDKEATFHIKQELSNIFGFEKINKNERPCFIFHFEKNTEIPIDFNDLFNFQLNFNLSDSGCREFLIKMITNNLLSFHFYRKILHSHKIKPFKKDILSFILDKIDHKTNHNIIHDKVPLYINRDFKYFLILYTKIFEKTDFKDISRLTIGFDIKELKNLMEILINRLFEHLLEEENIRLINRPDSTEPDVDIQTNDIFKEELAKFKKSKYL